MSFKRSKNKCFFGGGGFYQHEGVYLYFCTHVCFCFCPWFSVNIKNTFAVVTLVCPLSSQESILQKVVMTAFADRTVVTIAVSISPTLCVKAFTVMHAALSPSSPWERRPLSCTADVNWCTAADKCTKNYFCSIVPKIKKGKSRCQMSRTNLPLDCLSYFMIKQSKNSHAWMLKWLEKCKLWYLLWRNIFLNQNLLFHLLL